MFLFLLLLDVTLTDILHLTIKAESDKWILQGSRWLYEKIEQYKHLQTESMSRVDSRLLLYGDTQNF